MNQVVRIGTRGSALSLWQAERVAGLIRQHHPSLRVTIQVYRTRGDLNRVAPLADIGGSGLFTEALEVALLAREIDCAVHSLKDLPVRETEGLAIGAIPQRGDHRDVLVSRGGLQLAQLPAGARIGTGSSRRRSQLLARRPDLAMQSIRGNVPTRIDKLLADDASYDAIVLAAAGLKRLELDAHISEIFEAALMLSAAGQGALAVQCRADAEALALVAPLNDSPTVFAVTAERAFLRALDAGCLLPVGAFGHVQDDRLQLQGRVLSADGARQIDVAGARQLAAEGDGAQAARDLGARLAQQALAQGADLLLRADSPGKGEAGRQM